MTRPKPARRWSGPTIREIAELSGLGVATVDRVLNGRPGVRNQTRERVNAALNKLQHSANTEPPLQIALLCESGMSFNRAIADAADVINRSMPGVLITGTYSETSKFDPQNLAAKITEAGETTDGLILIAREHPTINSAVRSVRKNGLPVVCLTTDLPSSRRNVYVGNDQHAAGSVAAQLIGQALPKSEQKILIVMSVPFRCQLEREMGFRRVLRSTYPHLRIEERVMSDDIPETTFEQLRKFLSTQEPPPAIYNIAGANRGVAQALEASGCANSTIFVGHELTPNSQQLLESGTMDYVISHDFRAEMQTAIQWVKSFHLSVNADPDPTQILVHTRYNCTA
ncbi:MAG: LacI family DNA-binding transcriptional regulator [Stappiaceae bacterium]